MNEISPFTLQVHDLLFLGPDRAVEFFRRLLWAEAANVGVARNLIDVPQCINVGDGGIDAFIDQAQPLKDDLIPYGTGGFQIKSSDLEPAECKKELHQATDLTQPIKPEIRNLLDKDGTYILVLFAEPASPMKKRREKAIKEELSKLGYSNAKVRIYTASQLVGFAEQFPALIIWLKPDLAQCLPYSTWAKRIDIARPKAFVIDDVRETWTSNVRKQLRNPSNQCQIYRVTGLPGIGKTRLIFEALSADDLKNRVIYVVADQFRASSLHYHLQNNSNLTAILVIDECDLLQHDDFVRSFAGQGPRLTVFTLSYDIGNVPPPSAYYRLELLKQSSLEQIVAAEIPGLPPDVVSRLAKFADGYPRIAALLSESYLSSSSAVDEFLKISDDALMNKLIAGRIDSKSDEFKRNKRALTGLALFQKIGYEGRVSKESGWLAQYLGIAERDFREIVSEQKNRGILQGQNYLYVTPFMLRVYLLQRWWEEQGFDEHGFVAFITGIPEEFRQDLFQRFIEHIPFITTVERGRQFVQAALGEQGLFHDATLLLTKVGANFFLRLTGADPQVALVYLKKTVGTWSKDDLLKFTTGRREVVWALQEIAVWKELFADSARLLLALGEAENETWSNNASGVFAGLFSPAAGQLAPTEASPQERFPVLQEALTSSSKERRLLALSACDQALETRFFSRTISEARNFRKEPERWTPKTWGELFDAYRQVWQLLCVQLERLPQDEQEQAIDILLNNARGLLGLQNLADMTIDTLHELSGKTFVDRKKILATAIEILHYSADTLPSEIRLRLEQLRDMLTGSGLPALLKRYVGMSLLEDTYDAEGKNTGQLEVKIQELAQQAVENIDVLQQELHWLVTAEAQNGYIFGYEVGKRDADYRFLSLLIDTQRQAREKASPAFLSGYLRVIFERDQQRWEEILDSLAENNDLNQSVPELTWRSGISNRALLRVLDLAERGVIGVAGLRTLGLGNALKTIAEDIFERLIVFLLNHPDLNAALIALELHHSYYLFNREPERKVPEELTLKVITHESLFGGNVPGAQSQVMIEYYWAEIGKVFVELYPARGVELAEKVLRHFGQDNLISSVYGTRTLPVLNEITRRYPEEIWKRVTEFLGPPIDTRAFELREWLGGVNNFFDQDDKVQGALSLIPAELIWAWIDDNVEARAWYIASFVPKALFREEGKVCLAREVLVRYGDREDVQRNLAANFSTEGWTGPESLHLEKKKQRLLDFGKDETNPRVRQWIDEYIDSIDRRIEGAKIEEEREGF